MFYMPPTVTGLHLSMHPSIHPPIYPRYLSIYRTVEFVFLLYLLYGHRPLYPPIYRTGLSLKLARAVPMSAINFLAYEQVYALWNGAA